MSTVLVDSRAPEAVRVFLDTYFRFHPEQASARGYPGFDLLSPIKNAEAVESLRAGVARTRELIRDVRVGDSASDEGIDLDSLRTELATATFFIDELNWPATNPLWYVEAGLDSIDAFDFRSDLDTRTRDDLQTARLAALPQLLLAMERGLTTPMQPYLDTAIEMLEGFGEYLDDRFSDPDHSSALYRAETAARHGIDRAYRFLQSQRANAQSFSPMGEEKYRRLLRDEHMITDPLPELIKLARRTLEEANTGLTEFMAETVPFARGGAPSDFGREHVLAYYRSEVQAMREAVLERDLMSLPPGDIEIAETPPHQQALMSGASYLPPPVYGSSRLGHFFISPIPEAMDSDEYHYYHDLVANRRARNLIVHEVYPGHHLQFLWAAAHPSHIRKVRDNDVMIEGWALYCEHMMREQGLFDELPSNRPWRALRMRSIRVIVDIGIHTGSLSLPEAVDFMASYYGPDSRDWIETEVRRYATEPTQAMSYVVGRHQVLRLRDEWRDKMGARFRLKLFHDSFLGEGSVPIELIRRKMLAANG